MTKIYCEEVEDCYECPMHCFDDNVCTHPDMQQGQGCPWEGIRPDCPLPDAPSQETTEPVNPCASCTKKEAGDCPGEELGCLRYVYYLRDCYNNTPEKDE